MFDPTETSTSSEEPMNCYRKAFDIFEINQDDIFILLVSRLIISYLEQNGTKADQAELDQFRKIFELLANSEELQELNFQVLFENFDHRLALARHLVKTIRGLEDSCRQQKTASFNLRMDSL